MINFEFLPFVEINATEILPNDSAIYFVVCGEIVLYVGKAVNLYARWVGHHRKQELTQGYDDCRVYWCKYPKNMLAAEEKRYIEQLKPLLNNKKRAINHIRESGKVQTGSFNLGDHDHDWLIVMARIDGISTRAKISEIVKKHVRESMGDIKDMLAYCCNKFKLPESEAIRRLLNDESLGAPVEADEQQSP